MEWISKQSGYLILLMFGILVLISGEDNISQKSNVDEGFFERFKHASKNKNELKACKICGVANQADSSRLVINGREVKPPNKYPWMASLKYRNAHRCGCALITDQYLLTAVHCILTDDLHGYNKPGDFVVEFLTSEATKTKPRSPVQQFIPHPQFTLGYVDNIQAFLIHDIALIKLKQKIECDEFANPICLPPVGFGVQPGTITYIAGWGDFKQGVSETSEVLLEARLKTDKFEQCYELDLAHEGINLGDSCICVKPFENLSPCKGDSGGPLFVEKDSKFYAIGIASFDTSDGGDMCQTDANGGAVYISVPEHMDWINEVIQEQSAQPS